MDEFYLDKDETFTLPCLASYMRAVLPTSFRAQSSESCSESDESSDSLESQATDSKKHL